jgi:outer membrane protein assembly factor BamE
MRHTLIAALMLSLVAGCSSSSYIGQHRIDVQQGNALDHESIARLKPGLSRTQVRFLLGTPLLVDPFRTDRWDYVYMFYAAGKLTEQKHIALFFDGDTLTRIEGDVPTAAAPGNAPAVPAPVTQTAPDVPAALPVEPSPSTGPAGPDVPPAGSSSGDKP